MVVSDNSIEFVSDVVLAWQEELRIDWRCIAPAKRTQSGLVEGFNGRLRYEFLNERLFANLNEARQIIED